MTKQQKPSKESMKIAMRLMTGTFGFLDSRKQEKEIEFIARALDELYEAGKRFGFSGAVLMTRDEALKIVGKGVPPPLQSLANRQYNHAKTFLEGFAEGYSQGVREYASLALLEDASEKDPLRKEKK